MKNLHHTISIALLSLLLCGGCTRETSTRPQGDAVPQADDTRPTANDSDSPPAGKVSPDEAKLQQLFEKLKVLHARDEVPSEHIVPSELAELAYFQIALARIGVAFQKDPARKKELEQQFTTLIDTYQLADTLEFSDNEAKLDSLAEKAFAHVDMAALLKDVSRLVDAISPRESSAANPMVSMIIETIETNNAVAAIVHADGSEEPTRFVRVNETWYVSYHEMLHPAKEFETTTTTTLIVTFEDREHLEQASATLLLEHAYYDRNSTRKLTKDASTLTGTLSFSIPLGTSFGSETPKSENPDVEGLKSKGFEASIARAEARKAAVARHPGVARVEDEFEREFRMEREEREQREGQAAPVRTMPRTAK